MQTVAEAIDAVIERLSTPDSPILHSYAELEQDAMVLLHALVIADLNLGVNAKVLRALSVGILIGIETERGR